MMGASIRFIRSHFIIPRPHRVSFLSYLLARWVQTDEISLTMQLYPPVVCIWPVSTTHRSHNPYLELCMWPATLICIFSSKYEFVTKACVKGLE
ncbi:hypothetical protein F4803DRAFT_508345 [Xylaria telfairii]|nr:hypothetical protein F4803DRAFT_508345 [Xylaria telfairii]